MLIYWIDDIANILYKKIFFEIRNIRFFLISYFPSSDISSLDDENNNIIKRLLNVFSSHSSNMICNIEKEKEKNSTEMK